MHPRARTVVHSNSMRTYAGGTLLDLALCCTSSSDWNILSNKLTTVSKLSFWVLVAALANHWTPGGVHGKLHFVAIRQKLWVTWGLTTCDWHLKWGLVFGTEPLTCEVCGNSALCQNWIELYDTQLVWEKWLAWEKVCTSGHRSVECECREKLFFHYAPAHCQAGDWDWGCWVHVRFKDTHCSCDLQIGRPPLPLQVSFKTHEVSD